MYVYIHNPYKSAQREKKATAEKLMKKKKQSINERTVYPHTYLRICMYVLLRDATSPTLLYHKQTLDLATNHWQRLLF